MNDTFFTDNERELIKTSLEEGHKSWNNDCLENLKSRLKEHIKKRQNFVCCYCLRNLNGEFNFVIDIEHILPKSKFTHFMFTLDNLAVSCKRCNMNIKGDKLDFISCDVNASKNPFRSENYYFIHPNSDIFEDHIEYTMLQKGRKVFVFYNIINNSIKGRYSYDFFKLDRLVINCFDEAQGLDAHDENSTISSKLMEEIKNLEKIYEQGQ